MTLAFTICSVNYLAQARTLGDSLRQTNPDWQFVIGLVDRLDGPNALPTALYPPYPMLEVANIGIPDFAGMCARYDITELNTAVKPFFIDYFYTTRTDLDAVIYFDPDIIVFQPLVRLSASLQTYSIVLTPHCCSPNPDWLVPNDQTHLNTGIFNLGFIGLRNDAEARQFVHWWKDRLVTEGRHDLCAGLFVDQFWVNYAPVYWENVYVEKHLGYNVAYWNLHERFFSRRADGTWLVNDAAELQFFHYSGYGIHKPGDISKYQERYTFTERPDAWPLFDLYRQRLIDNGNETYRPYPCVYIKPPKVRRYLRVRRVLKTPFVRLLATLESR